MLRLESVGTFYDLDDQMTYPMQIDNTPDMDGGVHIEDCCDEWWGSLSLADLHMMANAGKGIRWLNH